MSAALGLLLLTVAQASVATVPVSKETIAKYSDRLSVQCTPGRYTTLRVRIRPAPTESFTYAELLSAPPGQPGWRGQVVAEPLDDGRLQVTLTTSPEAAPGAHLSVLLDNTAPDRPAVGWLYQLDLDSFRC